MVFSNAFRKQNQNIEVLTLFDTGAKIQTIKAENSRRKNLQRLLR